MTWFALALVLLLPHAHAAAQGGVRMERLADGVYAAVRTEGSGNIVNGNSLVIVGPRDIVVVDATSNPASARELIAAIRRTSPLPVSHLVLTHWHGDHTLGAQAFTTAWPGVAIVAHPATRDDIAGRGAANRAEYHAGLPGTLEFLRERLASNRGLDDSTMTAAERALLTADVAVGTQYASEMAGITPPVVTTLVPDRLVLRQGGRAIEIRHLGRGNTAGDLVVWLPAERIVATGDVVVHPTPYAFDSYLDGWTASLDTIIAMRPAVVVPGHGPVMRDVRYVRLLSETFHDLLAQGERAVAAGGPPDSLMARVDVRRHEPAFAGSDRARRQLWRFHFAGAARRLAIEAAHRHSTSQPGNH